MPQETWYVLEDGTAADPRDVAPDAGGVLRHSGGVAVAMVRFGPRSRGMSAEEVAAARGEDAATPTKPDRPARNRQMTAAGGASYKTR